MTIFTYTATKLSTLNKEGILKPDSQGYYQVVIGGLNVFNSAGEYYQANGARALIEDKSSVLMRRLLNGNLKGEMGHPKKLPGMSRIDYMNRIMNVEETNVSHHFRDLWLDTDFGKNHPEYNNSEMISINASIKPAGPKGEFLEKALNNSAENTNFSVRGGTQDKIMRGINYRTLEFILTWDWVTEPGIAIANKWDSPSLESVSDNFVITEDIVQAVINNTSGIATESSVNNARDLLSAMTKLHDVKSKPLNISKW